MAILRRIWDSASNKSNGRARLRATQSRVRRRAFLETLEGRRLLAADMEWVKPFGDAAFDYAAEVATDENNNVYSVSRFAGDIDLDPDATYPDNRDLASVPLTGYGLAITKFDSAGNLLWSQIAQGRDGGEPGSQNAIPKDVQVAAGGVFVAGSFYDLWDFDPGDAATNSTVHQTGSGPGSFLLRIDASTGDFDWVNGFGLTANGKLDDDSLAVDPLGNAYLSQFLREGGTIGDQTVPAQPNGDSQAIVKIASDGQILGYHQLNSDYLQTPALELVTPGQDPDAWRLYISAGFTGELSLDGATIATNPQTSNVFLAALTPTFDVEFVNQYELPMNQYAGYLSHDGDNLYLAGDLGIDQADGTGSALLGDDFVYSIDLSGNLQYSIGIGDDNSSAIIWSLEATDDGVFVGGYFFDTVNIGGESLTSVASADGFVAKLNSQLDATLVRQYSGTRYDRVRDIAHRSDGMLVIAGSFEESATIPVVGGILSAGDDDGYFAVVDFSEDSGGNSAPVSLDDQYSLPNRTSQVAAVDGLLANDIDPDGDTVSIELLAPPSHGTVQISPDGSFSFTPNAGFLGQDSLIYRISDGEFTSDPTTVSLEVFQEVVLFEDSFEVATWNGKWVEDYQNDWFRSTQRATDGNYSAEVDGRAYDATLTVSQPIDLSSVAVATLSFDWLIESGFDNGEYLRVDLFDGQDWSVAPRGYLHGNDDPENTWLAHSVGLADKYFVEDFRFRFSAKVSGSSEDANVDNVRLVGLLQNDSNQPPVASNDSVVTNEDQAVTVDVLANDSDPDGDTFGIQWVSNPTSGTAAIVNGQIEYTPAADFDGSDSFTYAIVDAAGQSSTATVDVSVTPVNDAPSASADSYSLDQDTTFDLGAPGILANDSDVEGDSLLASLVAGPNSGSLTLHADGSFSYTPDAGFVGTDSFNYQAVDSSGHTSNTVAVTLQIDTVVSGPNLSHGVIESVSTSWQTVNFGTSYDSAVVVATPRYNGGSGPGVVRIRNVTSTSFDVRVDNAGASPFSGGVHFIALEEGVYDAPGEYKLEAVKVDSSMTSGKSGGWQVGSQSYQQTYANPVVVGQVMSTNDEDWSVFWSSSSSRTSPANSGSLNIGKHVAEDTDTTRASETLGYIVIESTSGGTISGLSFSAGVGGDTIRGVGNGTYRYDNVTPAGASTAVLSSAGMDGGDGSWAALIGNNPLPVNGGSIDLAVDEDQIRDSERNHTTEQVAYFIIGESVGEGETAGAMAAPEIRVHNPLDVNGDGLMSPIDVLQIINYLNADSSTDEGDMALDTNGDGHISPIDALIVINHMNARGEPSASASDTQIIDSYFGDLEDEDEEDSIFSLLLA